MLYWLYYLFIFDSFLDYKWYIFHRCPRLSRWQLGSEASAVNGGSGASVKRPGPGTIVTRSWRTASCWQVFGDRNRDGGTWWDNGTLWNVLRTCWNWFLEPLLDICWEEVELHCSKTFGLACLGILGLAVDKCWQDILRFCRDVASLQVVCAMRLVARYVRGLPLARGSHGFGAV